MRAAEPTAVDQAGVIVPVTENDIVTGDERGHGAKIGSEAGREQQRSRSVLKSCDVPFELAILWRTARDQRTCSSTGRDSRGRVGQARVTGESEIVVCGEIDQIQAVDPATAVAERFDEAARPGEVPLVEVLQAVGQPRRLEVHAVGSGSIRSRWLPTIARRPVQPCSRFRPL